MIEKRTARFILILVEELELFVKTVDGLRQRWDGALQSDEKRTTRFNKDKHFMPTDLCRGLALQ